jgi:hypothetical protein
MPELITLMNVLSYRGGFEFDDEESHSASW